MQIIRYVSSYTRVKIGGYVEDDENTNDYRISQMDMDRDTQLAAANRMRRMCRYCEVYFIAEKRNQRFHASRCGVLYNTGNIHEETFDRWRQALASPLRWYEGEDDYDSAGRQRIVEYPTPQNYARFDSPRAKVYMTIMEIRARAQASNRNDAAKAWQLLSECLLELWKLPAEVDLFCDFNCDATEEVARELGFNTRGDLPARGMEGLKKLTEVYKERWYKGSIAAPLWWDFINI